MTAPLVTVCVPTIGRTAMLTEALESLYRQAYGHLEILLLDNASDHEAQQILHRYADRDPRARILRCEPRLPMFANFNRGIRAANGAYVTFLFDDDPFLEGLIERGVQMFTAHPTVGFVGSNYALIDESGLITNEPGLIQSTRIVPGREYISAQVCCASMIIGTPGTIFRRDLVTAFPFDEALSIYGGDLVMRLRMAEVADVALVTEPLVHVRIHPTAETASLSSTQSIVLRTQLLSHYIAEYGRRWPDDRAYIRSLKRGLARSHIAVLLWDWIVLGDDAEAEQRRLGLGAIPPGAWLSRALAAFERLGLSARRRRAILAPLIRRLGRGIRSPYEQPVR